MATPRERFVEALKFLQNVGSFTYIKNRTGLRSLK